MMNWFREKEIPQQYHTNFYILQVDFLEEFVGRVRHRLSESMCSRATILVEECHSLQDAFQREVQRTDVLGVGTSAMGVISEMPVGLRHLDEKRETCVSRIKDLERSVQCMVSVLTLEALETLREAGNGEMIEKTLSTFSKASTDKIVKMEEASVKRRLEVREPLHGPIMVSEGAEIPVRWDTIGDVPHIDVFLKRAGHGGDIFHVIHVNSGYGTPQRANKTFLIDHTGRKCEGISNNGSVCWRVPPALPEGDYFISIRCSKAGKVVSADSCLLASGQRQDGASHLNLAAISVLRPAALSEHWSRMKGWNVKDGT